MNWLDLSISVFNTRYGFSYSTWVLLPKEAKTMEDVVNVLAKRGTFQDVLALFDIIERADWEAALSAKWVLSDWMESVVSRNLLEYYENTKNHTPEEDFSGYVIFGNRKPYMRGDNPYRDVLLYRALCDLRDNKRKLSAAFAALYRACEADNQAEDRLKRCCEHIKEQLLLGIGWER